MEGLSQALGVPVVIDNRPGANGNIGIQAAVRAAPDDHTLLLQYSGYRAGNPAMMRNITWDPVRDLAPVAMATMAPHVPYRGAAPALQDVAGGRVEIFITTPSSAIALVQAGRVKALAMASATRSAGLPDVPTTAEAGLPGFTMDAWFAFFAPAGVPEPVLGRLNAEFRRLALDPGIRRRAEEGGAATAAMTIPELDALARREIKTLGAVIRGANIVLD